MKLKDEQLGHVREVEGRGNDHVGRLRRLRAVGGVAPQDVARDLPQHRQHREQAPGQRPR